MKPKLTERGLVMCLASRNLRVTTVTEMSNGFIGRGYVLGQTFDEALDFLAEIGYPDETVRMLDGGGVGVAFY